MREPIIVSAEIGGDILSLETGALANQANSAVVVRYGDSVVLVTATMSAKARTDIDFFPLVVDFEERKYAIGKIPGGFVKRGGRPSDESIVQGRLVDRAIRPLFPKGMRNEVQVVVLPLSVDFDHPPAVLGLIGASAALTISDIPWNGPVGAVRVGYVEGEFIINPNSAMSERSAMELVVASRPDHVVMIEADADQVPEEVMLQAIELAHLENQKVIALIEELRAKAGKPKAELSFYLVPIELKQAVKAFAGDAIKQAIQNPDKLAREAALDQLKEEIVVQMNTPPDPESPPPYEGRELELRMAVDEVIKETVRQLILEEGKRPDGRAPDEIREVRCAVGFLPRTHGSGLFQRGQTQVLTTCTLGALHEAQILDALVEEETKRYMHFYNFPPFSTGEVRPIRGPGRREVGHGMLAERALMRMIPPEEEFPYAILLYSEVLESNGSTSMASVCGSTLALMDAGVPIKAPVAGIATGLVYESDDRYVLLTDIQGMEDACGDMDFKVAGTAQGITAIQLDLKIPGLPMHIIAETLQRARQARLFILQKMLEVIPAPRPELSPRAPRIFVMEISPDKIGDVIGPGGKTVKRIIAETGAQIQIEQTGKVYISAPDSESGERARQMIEALTREISVGEVYTGRVTRLMARGVFVEVLPGKEGLLELRELSDRRISRPDEVVKVGDILRVRVKEIDHLGRINLTTRGLEQPREFTSMSTVAQPLRSMPHPPERRPAPPRPDRPAPRPDRPPQPPRGEDFPKPQFRPKR
ncbi:MAG: polyribonucleotide nucleotidyltransferase [Fimbriimonadales bacterium]|nr:polyribonucleotide nucleotidyltransferase [Fimbriimonadales bacterium]MDW8052395.1 polyribonucleotide nucleotidyltransferase [Armatimonadota bacterium]